MRITAKIATSGMAGLSRFPVPNATIDECRKSPDGPLDEALVRKALNVDGVQFSSDDNIAVLAFTLEYLKQQRSVVEHLADSGYGSAATEKGERGNDAGRSEPVHTEAKTRLDTHCERRLAKGRCAFVRTDIDFYHGCIRARLSFANPRTVVGYTEEFAGMYAEMCARILVYLRGEFKRLSNQTIILGEGENCAGIFRRAKETNDWFLRRDAALAEVAALSRKRSACRSLVNGFCSPSTPSCPLYRNGRCQAPQLPPEFAETPKRR